MKKEQKKEEVYHLTPLSILGNAGYQELQRYMLLLKEVWKVRNGTVAVILENGELHFGELELHKGRK